MFVTAFWTHVYFIFRSAHILAHIGSGTALLSLMSDRNLSLPPIGAETFKPCSQAHTERTTGRRPAQNVYQSFFGDDGGLDVDSEGLFSTVARTLGESSYEQKETPSEGHELRVQIL